MYLLTMQALVLDAENQTARVKQIPKPVPAVDELLVRVHAVALNPVDALYVANPLGATGRVVGSDFAGVVESVGLDVDSHLTGKRVAGFLQGACSINDRPGAFAEYLVVPWDLVWRVPDFMKFEEAATISLCGLTAAQALFYRMNMPAPFLCAGAEQRRSRWADQEAANVLIYGASTSLGLYAAQLVRQSLTNARLIGVASAARHVMLRGKPFSYNAVIDYRDKDWPERVKQICEGEGVDYALDCISEGDTVYKVNSTLAEDGEQAISRSAEGGAWDTSLALTIKPSYGAVWEGLGEDVQYQGMTLPKSPKARDFAVRFYQYLSEDATNGMQRLHANPVRLMPGGLARIVEDGLALLGTGSMDQRVRDSSEPWMAPVSAEKLVYTLISDDEKR